MKFKKTILLLFLASHMVTLGGVPAKVDKVDHEVDRSRFKALFLDKNIFDDVDKISDASLKVIRLAACVVQMDMVIQPIRSDPNFNSLFYDKFGNYMGPGETSDNIAEPAEKARFKKEKDDYKKDMETLNSCMAIRRRIIETMTLIADKSEGDAKVQIMNLADALNQSGS
jgi:hypothetical protein